MYILLEIITLLNLNYNSEICSLVDALKDLTNIFLNHLAYSKLYS